MIPDLLNMITGVDLIEAMVRRLWETVILIFIMSKENAFTQLTSYTHQKWYL